MLVVNVALPREALRQLGRQMHSSMARAIQPFHTPDDGDILFSVSTGEIPAEGIDTTALGVIASELVWDAVLSCYDPNAYIPDVARRNDDLPAGPMPSTRAGKSR